MMSNTTTGRTPIFIILTGFEEPESFCVLAPGHRRHEYVLFVRPRDREKEIWNGYRAGVEGAIQQYGAEMAYTNDQLEDILTEMLQNASALYYSLNKYPKSISEFSDPRNGESEIQNRHSSAVADHRSARHAR